MNDTPPSYNIVPVAITTVVATILLMVLSMVLGGFASPVSGTGPSPISWPIVIHLATALPALLLGPVILRRRKGDSLHKLLGRIWVALMLVTAIASAFIRTPGGGIAGTGFSLIHIFTVWTLVTVPIAVRAARARDVETHRNMMTGVYVGLCIAGLFTLLPGRLLGNLAFG